MLRTVVLSAVCGGGLGIAMWMVAAWGRTPSDRQPLLVVSDDALEVAERTVRAAVVGIVGGIIAGVLVAGLGGRLMMRVLAATSGDSAQGLVTEAHETVGDITLGGSVGFVVFNGIFFGAIGGVGYVLLRSWLPPRPWLGGLVFGVALLGLAPLDALDPGNRDFSILRPSWLAVALTAGLFPLFGMTTASVVERLGRTWPLISAKRHAILAYSPLLVTLVLAPIGLGIVLAVGLVVVMHRRQDFVAAWHGPVAAKAGRIVLVVLLVAATFSAGSAGLDILDA